MMPMKKWKRRITALMVLAILAIGTYFVKLYFSGKFSSVETLQEYMKTFGPWAPLVLTWFQILQVVVPVLPGMVGCAVGAILFGVWGGFWCNYIGICVGSIIAYYLARKFGLEIVLMMFPERLYEKWSTRIARSRSFDVLLFVATLLPLFPDDFLCYFSGLVKMDSKKFTWIILLGKPWCIFAYCVVFGLI